MNPTTAAPPIDPGRMGPELQALLRLIAQREPGLRLPFLVTLNEGTPLRGAAAGGLLPFEPTLTVELTRLAGGEMTAGQALALAREPRVERIDLDGEADALARRFGLRA
jgi:hypothetical protein